MALVHQVCNMSTYRQIQGIFDQLNHVFIKVESYCENSKECTLFGNLFCQVVSKIHHVNDNDNKVVKYYTCSPLNTPQSKNMGLVEKNVKQILETFIW